jgi:predicted PhzF superfamily epimerase YddE/YHI9
MISIPFTQVDAFASEPFTGNPAAVIQLEHWLDDAVLQAIAEENNLAETAFTVPLPAGSGADYELRWFTPTIEVALCGHATLASGHTLMKPDQQSISFRTRQAGDLTVTRIATGETPSYALDLPAWRMEPADYPEVAALISSTSPTEMRAREGGYHLFVYEDEALIRDLRPDFPALARFGPLLLIATAPGKATDVVSRVFLPGGGIDEDPVTGAAHCLLTPYWAARLNRHAFSAYQASRRGGHVDCRLSGDRAILEGGCRTVIEGRFQL